MQTAATFKKRGIALVAVCLSMLAAGVIGVALLSGISASRHQRLFFDAGNRAYYAAESGRSYAYSRKSQNPYYIPVGTFLMDSGEQFMLSSVRVDTNLVVTSTGIAHPDTDRESRQSVTFLLEYVPPVGLDNVFLWAQQIRLRGTGSVLGPGGTIVITGDMIRDDLSGGTELAVSTIFVEGDAVMTPGATVTIGSRTAPGNIYISGNLDILGGSPTFYGDIHVKGNLRISHGTIHGNMYIHGDVYYEGNAFNLVGDSRIYYAGALVNWPVSGVQADKAVALAEDAMPPFPLIEESVRLRDPAWYAGRGYIPTGDLQSDLRIYTSDNYAGVSKDAVANVVIVSEQDIAITMTGQGTFVGVLVAPNGTVTFTGRSFEGVVVAEGEFYVDAGTPEVTFRSVTEFFDDPDDYPFVIE
ncbi:MAG: hypothetical protein ACNA71_06540 [Kiritimatiellia bacterium]